MMNRTTIGSSNIEIPSFLKAFFPYKEKRLFWMPKNKALYLLMQNKASLIFINWMFQGTFGLSRIDLAGKIFFEALIVTIFNSILSKITPQGIILSIFAAHTFNWIFNTHFWVLGRFLGITRTPAHYFYSYLENLKQRIKQMCGLNGVIVIGGVSRGEKIRPNSDIDIYFISQSNWVSRLKAMLFTIKERILAFFCMFPLDLHLYQNISEMNKHRKDEIPFILFDPQHIVHDFYQKQHRSIAYLDDFPRS